MMIQAQQSANAASGGLESALVKTLRTVCEMQRESVAARHAHKRIGLVPTMGFLHEGHLSLVRLARARCDVVVVSLFVNPTQFGVGEDLAEYPCDFDRDSALCQAAHVDALFCPGVGDMYPGGYSTYVEERELSAVLCGVSRPGHFRGVATVVTKLFNIVQPDIAVFGQKDAQQYRVIQQLTADLNLPVELVLGPTFREADGLAMSSRNRYLSGGEREDALCLYHALQTAQAMWGAGARRAADLRTAMESVLEKVPSAQPEYLEIVDYATLRPVCHITGPTLVALAVRIGRTRLIDNVILPPDE